MKPIAEFIIEVNKLMVIGMGSKENWRNLFNKFDHDSSISALTTITTDFYSIYEQTTTQEHDDKIFKVATLKCAAAIAENYLSNISFYKAMIKKGK